MRASRASFAAGAKKTNRKKHNGDFPVQSIRACLASRNLQISDLDHVGFSWKPWISYPRIPQYFFRFIKHVPAILRESRSWTQEEGLGMLNQWQKMHDLPNLFRREFGSGYRAKFHFLEHHFCHAASAFYCSPFEDSAILTVDGGGEWTTTQLSAGRGLQIKRLSGVSIPHSLGAFYQAIACYLGFQIISGPGKMMGLSAYGDQNHSTYDQMRKLIRFTSDGGFRLDLSYFDYTHTRKRGVSLKFERVFGAPPKVLNVPGKSPVVQWEDRHLHVAAAAQRIVEDAFLHMARWLHTKTQSRNLCVAGGVGLNSVANGRLIGETPFKEIFIQPAAADSGTSLGAALWIKHAILKKPRRAPLADAFLGPGYTDAECENALQKSGLSYKKSPDYTRIAARLLNENKILGWFQGRMEFGPRALGNRSILANPCHPDMKDILNSRVKFREGFRPFAPIVLEEACGEYFDQSYPNPYMLLVYQVRPEKRRLIPSVTHVDGTGRIQSVNHRENPQMWELLNAFKEVSGVPILINTSFNIKGEPIVTTPEHAVDSFERADMDYLVLGPYVAAKSALSLEHAFKHSSAVAA